ncbi:Cna B-type domain-containing protein [Companilactobacillus muriivasis]|uniref:Cna B-type domain-containing protein n=1 Tax=Companilactobacillus muriivasis TaxID=3081444 RepID=UPI0030C69278
MFKKGNNIFSLLIIILSIFMTSSVNIVNAADSPTPETPAVITPTNGAQATDSTPTTSKDWGSQLITKVQLQDKNGNPQNKFDPYDTIRAYWEFATPKGGVNDGDTITVTVPKELVITGDVTKGEPVTEIPGGNEIGKATLNKANRTVTITFNSYAANKSKTDTVTGSFFVSTSWNLTQVQENQNVPISWGVNGTATSNTDSTGSASVGQASVTDPNEILYKYGSYIENGDIIQWTVRVNYKGETINDAVYRDTLGKNQTLLNDADHPITVNSATADHATGKITNDTDNKFANIKATHTDDGFDVNLGTIDQTAIITYYTKIDNLAEKSTSYSNTGDLLSNKDELQNITINQPNTTLGSDAHDGDQVTSIMGHKIWSVPAGTKLPDSVTINLIQNGNSAAPYASKAVTADTNWSYVFNNLPKYDTEGNAYKYTVQETPVTGFTSIPDLTNYNITNVLSNMKVTKVWNDGENKDKDRPSSVRVGVYDGSGKMAPGTDTFDLSGENGWTHTFENLPADTYWYVSEVGYNGETTNTAPKGYISTQTTNNGNDYDKTITNTLATTLTVNKVWDDGDNQNVTNPTSVQIQLYQNDNNQGDQPLGDPVTLNSGNKWTYKFGANDPNNTASKTNQLPKYDADGNEITYSAEEVTVPDGYTMSSDFDSNDKTKETITNKYKSPTTPTDDTRDFTVNKVWSDNDSPTRPSSITVYLTANGTKTGDPVTIKPDTNGKWSYTWSGLAKNDADGKAIQYSADEDNVNDYDKKIVDNTDHTVTTITNTLDKTPGGNTGDTTTNLKVTKIWSDNNNQDKLRPSSVTVNLLKDDDTKVDSAELSSDKNWTHEFTGLDKSTKYHVTEDKVDNYTTHIDPIDSSDVQITNTHTPSTTTTDGKTNLNVTKTWSDSNNKDNLRPSQVTIHLLKDGKEVDSTVLNADNNWAHNFTGLDKASTYTVSEDAVSGYTSNIDKTSATNVKITNTHTPSTTTTKDDKTNLTVNKLWNDSNNKDNLRPSQVTVRLLKNGSVIGQAVQLSSLNAWSYTWNNLDKNGNYSVQEDAVSGYTAAQSTNNNVITITNTHTPKTPGNPDNPDNPFIPDNPGGNNGNNGGNGSTGDQINTDNGGGGNSNTTTDFTPGNPMVPSVPYQKTNTSNGLLPQTGSKDANILYSILGVLILGFISIFELKRKRA